MLKCAFEYDADTVEGGYSYTNCNVKICIYFYHKAGKLVDISDLHGYPWGKVFKASLFEKSDFPKEYWFEDSVCRQILYEIGSIRHGVSEYVYRYRINRNGISNISHKRLKVIDTFWTTKKLFEERKELEIPITDDYYCYILRMARLRYFRTFFLEKRIRRDVFFTYSKFINDNFQEKLRKEKVPHFEYAICNNNFATFSLWCELQKKEFNYM